MRRHRDRRGGGRPRRPDRGGERLQRRSASPVDGSSSARAGPIISCGRTRPADEPGSRRSRGRGRRSRVATADDGACPGMRAGSRRPMARCASATASEGAGPDLSTLRRNSRAEADDQRDPQGLPGERERDAATAPCSSAARRDHRERRGHGKIAAPIASRARRARRPPSRRGRRSAPAPWSPASTASGPRARSRPGRRCRGTARRAAGSSSRNRPARARGRPASRPPASGSAARPPADDQSRSPAAPAPVQTAIPTSEIASIANSLPRKMASIGTAAASTSMTLFDFSSTSWTAACRRAAW